MKESKVVKAMPSSENGPGVVCNGKYIYIITQDLKKQRFTLWKKVDEGYEKMGSADSPIKLYDKIEWF